jgi:D-lactate dehydrogenase (cytochrome)
MNIAAIRDVEPEECPLVEGESTILESYASYLIDESRMDPQPVSAIYFPKNTVQVVDAVKKIIGRGERIVVSASRTGIVGGAVGVENTSIISLEKMSAQLGYWRFQAGVKLEDIQSIQSEYYPLDPTEMTASLGGTAATDASGARTYHYGSTRDFIKALTVVLADGTVLKVHRGDVTCENGKFILQHPDGETVIPIANINMPPVKHTAGLYLKEGMDIVDLFIGSEGTLGIITEVEIETVPLPADRLFLVVYAEGEDQAIELVETVKSDARISCLAMEYFDPNAVALILDNETFPNLPGTRNVRSILKFLWRMKIPRELSMRSWTRAG